MHSFPSRPSKPVRAVVQAGDGGKIEAALKDIRPGHRHLLNVLEQFGKWVKNPPPKQMGSNARLPLIVPGDPVDRRTTGSDGVRRVPRSSACFICGREGHYSRDCGRTRLESREPQVSATEPSSAGSNPAAVRKNNSIQFRGEESHRVYLEVLVDGHPVYCLLNTGSEVTLIPENLVRELHKKPITSQIRAANGTIIEVLGLMDLPVLLRGKKLRVSSVASMQENCSWGLTGLKKDMRRGELYMYGSVFPLKAKQNEGWVRRVVVQEAAQLPPPTL